MEADKVGVSEGLSQGVCGVYTAGGGVQRVLACPRSTARMSGNALVYDVFGDASDGARIYAPAAARMNHKGDTNAVEISSAQELTFTAHILYFSLFLQRATVFYL